jgi:hypothetical protein
MNARILDGVTLALALSALTLPLACSGPEGDGDSSSQDMTAAPTSDLALDVNDISFLFPIVNGKPVPEIGMDLKGSSTAVDLFPQTAMDDMAKFEASKGVTSLALGVGDRPNWRVVGFRVDPCVQQPTAADAAKRFPVPALKNLDTDIATCTLMIRLVVTPFVNGKDVDAPVHLNYGLGAGAGMKASRDRIIAELQVLKSQSPVSTSGVPLGPHPGLAKDEGGAFATAVRDFLANELSHGQLALAAAVGTQAGDPWVFVIGPVDANKHWTPGAIKGFGVAAQGESEVNAQMSFHGSHSIPAATVGQHNFVTSTNDLFNGDPDPTALEMAQQVNNPRITTLFNTDCISCHSATERVIDKKVASSAGRFPVPKGVTGYVEQRNAPHVPPENEGGPHGKFNFRAFGYFGGQPTVSYRTANETAELVDHINRDLLHKDAGPGPVCDDVKVWSCFRDGSQAAECLTAANGCEPPK